ncbi:MAG: hypothetical protein OEU32_18300 [Acidimicrobiia bacterium]|nr:hypothetical protein [Acidimicrobiia bacterium]
MAEQRVWLTKRPEPADKDLEADDPYELTGVRYAVAPGVDADRETARTLIEEFAMQGWSPDRIAAMFADPHAGSAHDIYRRRGDLLFDELLDEVFGPTRGSS